MQQKGLVLMFTTLMLTVACAPSMKVHNDFDSRAAFGEFRTFDWAPAPGKTLAGDPRTTNPFLDDRIRAAIEAELVERGYQKAAAGGSPDLLIAYHAAIEEKLDVDVIDQSFGWRGWSAGTRTEIDQYDEGTLVIDIADARSNRAIWRGWGQGAVDHSTNPARNYERLRYAIDRILTEFPPHAGS